MIPSEPDTVNADAGKSDSSLLVAFPEIFNFMEITFNGLPAEVKQEQSLSTFLQDQALLHKTGIAVAINQKVIPRKDWEVQLLQAHDAVLVIRATQGG